jgi:hypothetical protein
MKHPEGANTSCVKHHLGQVLTHHRGFVRLVLCHQQDLLLNVGSHLRGTGVHWKNYVSKKRWKTHDVIHYAVKVLKRWQIKH